jgi:hypothetical protein
MNARQQPNLAQTPHQQQSTFTPGPWAGGMEDREQPKKRSRWGPAPEGGRQDPMEEAVTAAVLKEQARPWLHFGRQTVLFLPKHAKQ